MAAGTPKTTVWALEPHTKAKHDILRQYLGGWFPVLSKYNGRVVFLDGFAGPGRYSDDEPGSPLIALETLVDHSFFPRMNHREFLFIFCESDSSRVENLRREIATFQSQRSPWPSNVNVMIKNAAFADTAQDILDTLRTQKATLAPTFAFVDPFGISGIRMDTLAELLSFDQCELLVNFMSNTAQRFATAGNIDARLSELFGTDEYRLAEGLYGAERQRFLHDLYERQLKTRCTFKYVQSFGMLNRTGNVIYYLFYGTRSAKGLQLMKDAMWKIDVGGGHTFSDRLAGQEVLLTEAHIVPGPLCEALTREFAGQTVGIPTLEEYVLVRTPYRPAHLRKFALTPLEKAGKVTVRRRGKAGFPEGTLVTFD